jgi:pimeloyl-ACP methyl ester carboxylesterase
LFGAPYDWRYAPPVPGQTSQVYSQYFQRFKELVEAASSKHQKKAIIFSHSYGGMVALEFVRNMPLAWRNRYIKHLILAAPTLSAGFIEPVYSLVSGATQAIYVPTSETSLRTLWRSFETAIVDLPSPNVFGHDPIVATKNRNYSANDMEELLAVIGLGGSVEPFKRRMIPKMNYFEVPPMVPVTCINGVGIRTPRTLVLWDGDYDVSPEIFYDDGDGVVNLISMSAFEEEMCRHPRQKRQFKSVKIYNAQHSDLVMKDRAIKRVLEEILEANNSV